MVCHGRTSVHPACDDRGSEFFRQAGDGKYHRNQGEYDPDILCAFHRRVLLSDGETANAHSLIQGATSYIASGFYEQVIHVKGFLFFFPGVLVSSVALL